MLPYPRGRSLLALALLALGPLGAAGEVPKAPSPSPESDSRAETWRRARLEKAKRTRPPRQGFLERAFHPTQASLSSFAGYQLCDALFYVWVGICGRPTVRSFGGSA